MEAPGIARTARPGQFVNIDCGTRVVDHTVYDTDAAWPQIGSHFAASERIFLRRPFSVYHVDGARIEIIHRVIGAGTAALSRLQPGDTVKVLGPLGNLFSFSPLMQRAVLVAGGIGLPPLLILAQALKENGLHSVLLYGAHHREQVIDPAVREFETLCDEVVVTLETKTKGYRTGLITEPLQEQLHTGDVVYAVGPRGMLRAVAEVAGERGNRCYLLMEERMACGIGVCLSCMQMTTSGYRRMCVDGPVFDAREVLWA